MSDIELQELVINEAESDEIVERQTDLTPNQIIVTPTGASGVDYYGLPVGSIFASAIPVVDARVHLLDGSLITQSGIYAEFATLIKTLVSSGQPISCTQAEFTADVDRTGNCGKFVIDDANNAIRLPKITTFIQGLDSISDIGKGLGAGLPNITGQLGSGDAGGNSYILYHKLRVSGAFTKSTSGHNIYFSTDKSTGQGDWFDNVSFNANDGASTKGIYGNSDTVQPNATQFPYYIVLASGYKQQSQIDVDNIMNDVNGLANQFEQKPWLLDLYPVGTIYLTLNDKGSPASMFGGTWERLPSGYALWTTDQTITNEAVVQPNASNANSSRMLYSGLPDITGGVYISRPQNGYIEGTTNGSAITGTTWRSYTFGTNGAYNQGGYSGFNFNASSSNSIYGKSTTVQPPAYKVYAYKRIN